MKKFDFDESNFNLLSQDIDKEIIEKYQFDCDNIMKFISNEEKNFDKYFNDYSKRITKTEYATKSLCVPRGYYCPSKIIDFISNAKRGKLIKRGQYDFIYNFDENGKLIFVRRSKLKACEFIKHIDNCEIGIGFRRKNKIEAISECEFYDDGRIKQYSYYCRDSVEEKALKLEREFYKYGDNTVEVTITRFIPKELNYFNNKVIFNQEKYLFTKINENEFQYITEQIYPAIEPTVKVEYIIKDIYPF